jgi:hypothetical protein
MAILAIRPTGERPQLRPSGAARKITEPSRSGRRTRCVTSSPELELTHEEPAGRCDRSIRTWRGSRSSAPCPENCLRNWPPRPRQDDRPAGGCRHACRSGQATLALPSRPAERHEFTRTDRRKPSRTDSWPGLSDSPRGAGQVQRDQGGSAPQPAAPCGAVAGAAASVTAQVAGRESRPRRVTTRTRRRSSREGTRWPANRW